MLLWLDSQQSHPAHYNGWHIFLASIINRMLNYNLATWECAQIGYSSGAIYMKKDCDVLYAGIHTYAYIDTYRQVMWQSPVSRDREALTLSNLAFSSSFMLNNRPVTLWEMCIYRTLGNTTRTTRYVHRHCLFTEWYSAKVQEMVWERLNVPMSTGNRFVTQRLETEAQFDDSTVNLNGLQWTATVHRGSTTGTGHLYTGQGLYTTCSTALSHETSYNSLSLVVAPRTYVLFLLREITTTFKTTQSAI